MSEFSYDYSVLVVVEPEFLGKSKDADAYVEKLNKFLTTRAGESRLRRVSVTGGYGLPGCDHLEVDDRNKTAFIKSLDDHLTQFDEIVIITNFEKEPYLDALSSRADEFSKSLTFYGYETRV